jgi:hypothetical protein
MRGLTLAAAVVLALPAAGTARRAEVAVAGAGDCRAPGLQAVVHALEHQVSRAPDVTLLDPETALRSLRPRTARTVPALERQVEAARALLFGGESERGLDLVRDAIAELERASPLARPGPVLDRALLLEAQMLRNLGRDRESAEALRRVLRLQPRLELDRDEFPPSTLQALEAVRRELARARRGTLRVEVPSGPPAAVFLDGREVGRTGEVLDLQPGPYRVELALDERVSFVHRVTVGRQERLEVDLGFEARVAERPPLCAGDPAGATRLAGLLAAQRLLLVEAGAGPGEWVVTLLEVRTGARVGQGAAQEADLPALAQRLLGPDPAAAAPPEGAALALTEGAAPGPAASPPPAAPSPEAPALAGPDAPTALTLSLTPAATGPGPGPEAGPPPSVPGARLAAFTALGAGGALVASAVAVALAGGASRAALSGALLPSGRFPEPGSPGHAPALAALHDTDLNLAISLTLAGTGLGAAVAGVVGLLLFPSGGPSVRLGPAPGGGELSVEGWW